MRTSSDRSHADLDAVIELSITRRGWWQWRDQILWYLQAPSTVVFERMTPLRALCSRFGWKPYHLAPLIVHMTQCRAALASPSMWQSLLNREFPRLTRYSDPGQGASSRADLHSPPRASHKTPRRSCRRFLIESRTPSYGRIDERCDWPGRLGTGPSEAIVTKR
jgi:hypothetical protein